MPRVLPLLFLFVAFLTFPAFTMAQTGPGSGGTGDILVENWQTSVIYNSKTQPTRLYNEFDNAPTGEMKLWTKSLSMDGCFAQSKITLGTCVPKDANKDQNIYGPLLNNTGVGIDLHDHEGRKVSRYWLQQNTGHSHGARLQVPYTFLANYANRRIYARYYMKFPQPLPVAQSGGSWMSIGVEMKAHGCCVPATLQHNYDRNHQGWMASAWPNTSVSFNRPPFQANRWYKMDVIWDMSYTGGRWQAFIDDVKWGEGTGQLAQSNGYGLWIFNLYGDILQNQVRGEMYIGDFILSTQPIGNSLPTTTTPPVTVTQSPYSGSAIAIPGTIEAENFDNGGEGVSFHETSAANEGGVYRNTPVDIKSGATTPIVGWFINDEWLEYTINVAQAGSYRLRMRGGTLFSGRSFRVTLNDTALTTVSIPLISSWNSHVEFDAGSVNLPAGQHILRLALTGGDHADIDWLAIQSGGKLGDANNDGKVDGVDYVVWLVNSNKTTSEGPAKGDFNSDGQVNGVDYVVWLTSSGK